MTIILVFTINSISLLQQFPVQSEYMPTISYYFLLSIIFTLISMFWFLIINYLSEREHLPNWMLKISSKLCCSKVKQKKLDLEKSKNKGSELEIPNSEEKNEQGDVEIEDEKKLKKKNFDNAIILLRLLFFVLIFICMLVSYLYIWIDISS